MSKLEVNQANFERFLNPMLPHFYRVHSRWPIMCCDWTSKEILPQVQRVFEGEFHLAVGWFDNCGHTWIIEINSKAFLDPTVGQFGQQFQPPYQVFNPDDREYRRYRIEAIWEGVKEADRARREDLHRYLSERRDEQ